MAQEIACPHCGQTYTIATEQEAAYAGKSIQCTQCGKVFPVVLASPSATAVPVAPAPVSAPPRGITPPTFPGAPPGPPPMGYAMAGTYGAGPYAALPTSRMAITALVFACVGMILPPLGLVGLILGIIALTKMKTGQMGGKGLAIAGISVGGASLIILPCLLSILLPSFSAARNTANKVKCASNMREIGHALMLYANDNHGKFPPNPDRLLLDTDITAEVFVCPSSNDIPANSSGGTTTLLSSFHSPGHDSYVYCGAGMNFNATAETIVLYEVLANHGDGSNFLFADGHVEFLMKKDAQAMINDVSAGHNPPQPFNGGRR